MTTTDTVYADPGYLALVAAIREEPEDDTRRLVAADWLQERGEEERAEFIRVQCELHSYYTNEHFPEPTCRNLEPAGCGQCDVCSVVLRSERLLLDHPEWGWNPTGVSSGWRIWKSTRGWKPSRGDLRSTFEPGPPQHIADWSRGFVCRVSGPLAAFGEERECGCDDGSVDTGGVTPWGESITDCCPHCRGTGRVWLPAPAFADLCRREPLPDDGASVTDLDLLTMPIGLERRRISRPIGTLPAEGFLGEVPVSLFDLIPCPPERTLTFYKSFDSEGELRVALSTALVRAARSPKGD